MDSVNEFCIGYELDIHDARGARRVRVVCGPDSRGRFGVRNTETDRLSYVRPLDPRVKPTQHQRCTVCGTRFELAKYPNSQHCSTPEHRCIQCGYSVRHPGLCGECACEDDGDIW